MAIAGTPLLSAAPVACTGLATVEEGVALGFGIVYENDDLSVGFGATPVPVGRMVGRSYPPGPVGWIGATGVEAGGGGTGCEGGMIGATGVPDGGETGGAIGPVGPAGPRGCVPLWHPQSLGGVSAILITAGIGNVGLTGAGRAWGVDFGG